VEVNPSYQEVYPELLRGLLRGLQCFALLTANHSSHYHRDFRFQLSHHFNTLQYHFNTRSPMSLQERQQYYEGFLLRNAGSHDAAALRHAYADVLQLWLTLEASLRSTHEIISQRQLQAVERPFPMSPEMAQRLAHDVASLHQSGIQFRERKMVERAALARAYLKLVYDE
jgi:hypothetical protein